MPGWEAAAVHRDLEGREPQSWAESLSFYKHAQASRPFADEAYAKPPRVTRYEVSRREAEYNPITQTFRDESREQAARSRDAADRVRAANVAKDRQLAHERNTHDVLNHSLRRTGLPDAQAEAGLSFPMQKREQRLAQAIDSAAPFNIISGLSVEEHHWAPPQHRPRVAAPRVDNKLRSITQQPREFDILSNEYKRNHEQRTAEVGERARRVAAERFWATHDYDVMATRFHDPAKEAAFQEYRKTVAADQPLKAFDKLPPSYQQGEGYVYSITNFSVQNPELYRKFERKEAAAREAKGARWTREAEIVGKAEIQADIEATRTLQRASHVRYEDTVSHGYHILTNKGFFDKDPAPLPPARTAPKPTPWESLHQSSNHFWQTRSAAAQSQQVARPMSEGAQLGGGGASSRHPAVPALDMSRTKMEMTAGSSVPATSVRTGGFR